VAGGVPKGRPLYDPRRAQNAPWANPGALRPNRYIDEVKLRRAIERQLNKIEHAHRFTRRPGSTSTCWASTIFRREAAGFGGN